MTWIIVLSFSQESCFRVYSSYCVRHTLSNFMIHCSNLSSLFESLLCLTFFLLPSLRRSMVRPSCPLAGYSGNPHPTGVFIPTLGAFFLLNIFQILQKIKVFPVLSYLVLVHPCLLNSNYLNSIRGRSSVGHSSLFEFILGSYQIPYFGPKFCDYPLRILLI